ncbi:ABC transporter permease [Algoriphagus sp. C2-6-M1]|uniref:ABC transporter permease n=1 Tax=Algoriphagus persicinus TaxID=3108754 RepID=UPI002B37B9A3|nr:ABC transporter permease [Algoriphagus sp. C2-6-M1]MEB2780669.1 ABC transporter permease [Algoriphagus sp. C2-6-M1]
MFQNYLTSLWRHISKNKVFTFINIAGLAIGMLACILITQFVLHELSYDNFLDKKDRIFRIQQDRYDKGELSTQWAAGAAGIGPDLKSNFAEVKAYTRLTNRASTLSTGDTFFKEEHLYFASKDFFSIFSIKLVEGIDSMVLKEPNKMVLSQSMAKKYFGNEDPIGKTLKANGNLEFEISGVFEDLPVNTHMKIDVLGSFITLEKLSNDPFLTWNWDGFLTYILLEENTDAKSLEAKFPDFVQTTHGEELKKYNAGVEFHLQPVADIHLDSDYIMEFKPNGNRQSVNFLSIVALLIMIIAWINYINLSTAKSIERAREVGIRKVMGGYRAQLIQQFLTESLFLNFIAVILAAGLAILLTPWFSSLTGRELGYQLFLQPAFWLILLGLIILGALMSGLYPAFVLSSFRPVEVLKGKFKNSDSGVWLRKGMVVTQFIASITLMVGTFTVYQQLSFMQNQDLGVNIEQTVVLRAPSVTDSTYRQKYQVFKQNISRNTGVISVTASTSVPGSQPGWNAGGIRRLSQGEDEQNQYRVIMTDGSFNENFGLEMLFGREFSDDVANEHKNVLLNETATRLMGFALPEEAINDEIFFWGDTFNIVGVMKDYHQESLKKSFDALIFRYDEAPNGFYSVKVNTGEIKELITTLESDWQGVFPGNPFEYFFLDEHFDQQYKSDQQFGTIFSIFSALAIFIASLGLFGLSSLTAIQRTKEIGIRKVMGASLVGLLRLINKDFIILIFIAILFSVPLSIWIMNSWLQDFATRIPLSWWIFAIPSFTVVIITILTVSVHTIKVAMINPVKSLTYE